MCVHSVQKKNIHIYIYVYIHIYIYMYYLKWRYLQIIQVIRAF
jgi:hypothetical protein